MSATKFDSESESKLMHKIWSHMNKYPNILNYMLNESDNTPSKSFDKIFSRTIPLFLAIRKKLGYYVNEHDVYYKDMDSVFANKLLTEIWSFTHIELVAMLASTTTLLVLVAKDILLPHFNTETDRPVYNAIKRGIIRYMYETEKDFYLCNGYGEDDENEDEYNENNFTLPPNPENQEEETKYSDVS